jgi:APA family basic amino acid/polyamine antiporter
MGGGLPERGIVAAVLAGLAGVNCLGVKSGNGVQAALGALKLAIIGVLIGVGLAVAPAGAVDVAVAPPDGLKAFGAAMIPVVFSYGGWQTANYVAGEMKNPRRNLARALLVGVLAVIALYLLVNFACLQALGVGALGRTLTPASDVLLLAAGPVGARLAAAAIAVSALAFLSQGMLTGPRVIFAMARDGLFFRRMAQVGAVSRVPVAAIVLQAAWTLVLALSGSYEQILSYVIAMNFLFFGISASCLFVLRRRELAYGVREDIYRAPLHPWSTGLFILACAAIVVCSFWAYPVNSLVGYAILVLGVPLYLFWRRRETGAGLIE